MALPFRMRFSLPLLALMVAPALGASDPWEGWGTTTQFGSGDGPWGDDPATQVYVNALNNESASRMGAAVPWRFYFKWYGSKAGESSAVYSSITGESDVKACFLMQPILYYPSQLSGGTDGAPTTCTGSSCIDINDDRIVASYLDDSGVRTVFPEYLIVPFEGCGGDCKSPPDGPGPDCMNSCSVSTDFLPAIQGRFADTTGSACTAMRVLCGGRADLTPGTNCTWAWDDTVRSNFLQYSQPLGCSAETSWCKTASASGSHVNWCSGQNMHFDIALDSPYFKRTGSNAAVTTDPSNIVVRYKRVSCAIRGTFNPQDLCAKNSVDCGVHGHCVSSTGTCICDDGYSGSTCSVAVKCDGVVCPSGQRCSATTGACVVLVPPSVDLCAAARWTCQDSSMTTALASWCTALLQQSSRVYCNTECAATSDMGDCAACIENIYGLSTTCSWSSPSSSASSTTSATTKAATTSTTSAATPAATSSRAATATSTSLAGSTASSTTRAASTAQTTTVASTQQTTTTRATTGAAATTTPVASTLAATTTSTRAASTAAVSTTTTSTTRAVTTAASSSTTRAATTATAALTTAGAPLTTSAALCAAAQWTCQDPTIATALASWCTQIVQQTNRVYCTTECAASSAMSLCAACVAQLYGLASTCAWSSPGSSSGSAAATSTIAVTTAATAVTTQGSTTALTTTPATAATSTSRATTIATTTSTAASSTTAVISTTRAATSTTTRAATSTTAGATTAVATTSTTRATSAATTTSTARTTTVAASTGAVTSLASTSTASTTRTVSTTLAAPRENVDMSATVKTCADARWAPVNDYWSYSQIAAAFYEFGVAPWNFQYPTDPLQHVDDCVAALSIVAGECSPGVTPAKGCSASGSGASGVFQTDFIRTLPGYPTSEATMPLCVTAFGAGYMAAPFFADSQGTRACTMSYAGGTAAALYTCAGAPRFVNNYTSCPDPAAQPGVAYSNFIGPFCHKSYSMRWSNCVGCCGLFNGGANAGQTPFPQYYTDKAAEAEAATGTSFRSVCLNVAAAGVPSSRRLLLV